MFLCRCGRGRKAVKNAEEEVVKNEVESEAEAVVESEPVVEPEPTPQVREETYGANHTLNDLVKKGLELRLLPYIKSETITSIRIVDIDRIYLSDKFRVFIKREELIGLILELINVHSKKKYKIYFEGSVIIFKEKNKAFGLNRKKITKVQYNIIDRQLDNLELAENPFIYIEEVI